jgi:hypothetical protein
MPFSLISENKIKKNHSGRPHHVYGITAERNQNKNTRRLTGKRYLAAKIS